MKEHFNNKKIQKKVTDGQKLKKSETDCDMGFEKLLGWTVFKAVISRFDSNLNIKTSGKTHLFVNEAMVLS